MCPGELDLFDGRCVRCGMFPCSAVAPRLTLDEARAIMAMDAVYEGQDTAGEPTDIGAGNYGPWYAIVAEARARLSQGGTAPQKATEIKFVTRERLP